jgi:isopenicillin-N N-acyltransferase-like protein
MLRLVEVEGAPRSRGRQFGEKCKREINRTLAHNYRIIQHNYGLTREEAIFKARALIPKAKKLAPDLCEELEGVAEGSSTSFEDVFILNTIPEVMKMCAGGCTVISVDGELTDDGRRITAQTVDWNPMLEDQYVVLKVVPEKGPSMLTYTLAGLLALVGINSKGLGLFMNILLTSEKLGEGLPTYFILRRILEKERVGEALTSVVTQKKMTSFNYVVTDGEGDLYCVESLVDDYEVLGDEGGIFVHTNHILTGRLREKDIYVEISQNVETLTRFRRARKLLLNTLKKKSRIGIEEIKRILADHANYPDSICRHQREEYPVEVRFKTLAAIISKQGEGKMLINLGNPCLNTYKEYALK